MSEIGAFHVESKARGRTQFKFLTGDLDWQTYGGKFVSKKLSNGEFDYWLVLNVINMWEATGEEDQEKYVVEIHAVSPSQAGEDGLNQAIASWGMSDDDLERLDIEHNSLMQVECLDDYGIFAMLWSNGGNNLKSLLRQAHIQADMIQMMFGFYMDRAENMIGSTGWDIIAGDLERPIREYRESNQ